MSKRKLEHEDNQGTIPSASKRKLRHEDCQRAVPSTFERKLEHGDYTVGWICPLEVEQVAALETVCPIVRPYDWSFTVRPIFSPSVPS